ncbi:hypothetical protein FDP41_003871 [Naegleria fowleri]|uniref:Thioredoxin-like fold domain-containing protein n=1 Tax=Naegleria fowleri TaxID=5763 RepID=A0A6A5BTC2_NAEFO|nr:uncharacterized protein FDP41_003871 [Naegleria fowleri]KAF0977218.1 hypothetical protein FDP41_003871 [Naegleria fowleri]CAG4719616.1 unnamed protein product [Naegleria fowleri]
MKSLFCHLSFFTTAAVVITFLLVSNVSASDVVFQKLSPVGPSPSSLLNSWSIGDANTALVNCEVFFDLCCPDCAQHWTNVFKPLVKYYFNNSTQTNPKVRLMVHLMQLPMHIAGYYSSTAFIIVNKYSNYNADTVFRFLDSVFTNQGPIQNQSLQKLNQLEIFTLIYNIYVRPLNLLSLTQFINEMSSQENFVKTASMFRMATSRSVSGTPTFFVNYVPVFNGYQLTASDWISTFNNIIANN